MDEIFRDKLKDHEIPPSNHIWEGVNKAVNKRNRRLWPLLATIIILVSAAIFYFIWSTSNGTQASNNAGVSEVEHTQQQTDHDLSKEAESAREIADSDLAQNNESNPTSSEIVQRNENRANTADNNNSNSPETSSEKAARTPIANTDEEELTVNANSSTDNAESNASTSSTINKNENSTTASTDKSNKTDNALAQSTLAGEAAEDHSSTENETSGSLAPSQIVDNSVAEWDGPLQHMDATNEGMHRFEVSHFKSVEDQQKNILENTDLCAILYPKTKECPGFEDLSRRFQFDVYGLVGKKFSNLSTNNNVPGVNDYLAKRRATETPLWNIGLGVRLSNQWTNGLSVRGGLEISRGQIRLNYNDESKKTIVTNVTPVDTIVDSEGNTTVVWDTLSREVTNVIPVEKFNKFTLLDIPVTVGYTFLGSKYDIEINTGVVFNVLFEKSGNILAPDGEARPIDPSQSGSINAYNNELGISVITSAGFNYHLSDQLSVFAEPQLRYFIKPISPELYEIRESWFHLNVILGGRYSF